MERQREKRSDMRAGLNSREWVSFAGNVCDMATTQYGMKGKKEKQDAVKGHKNNVWQSCLMA